MKKLVALLLTVLLLASISFAEVDFNAKDYTDDELIEIMKAIYDSDSQLGYLYVGDKLVIGEDIPAGAYEFWVTEEDIAIGKRILEDNYRTLCAVKWGDEYGMYKLQDCIEIYKYEYGSRKTVVLKEGQVLWTTESYGTNYVGVRMRYLPNRKSGLFAEQ